MKQIQICLYVFVERRLTNDPLTYILTPWCRVLLEKLTGLQLVKKFPAFYGTRRFITALTSVLQMSLPWASPIQSIYPHPTSWRSILILSTHLRLGLISTYLFFLQYMPIHTYTYTVKKGKMIPLQAQCGPEGGQRYSSTLP